MAGGEGRSQSTLSLRNKQYSVTARDLVAPVAPVAHSCRRRYLCCCCCGGGGTVVVVLLINERLFWSERVDSEDKQAYIKQVRDNEIYIHVDSRMDRDDGHVRDRLVSFRFRDR